jgi:hypothetical protein
MSAYMRAVFHKEIKGKHKLTNALAKAISDG